ncbi:MAG: hypothetical protein ACK420_00525 [Sphingomonadales bacterium]
MIKVVLDWIFIFFFIIGGITHVLKLAHLMLGFSFLENITAFSSKEDSKTLKVCYYLLTISTARLCILSKLGYYQIVRV